MNTDNIVPMPAQVTFPWQKALKEMERLGVGPPAYGASFDVEGASQRLQEALDSILDAADIATIDETEKVVALADALAHTCALLIEKQPRDRRDQYAQSMGKLVSSMIGLRRPLEESE